VVLKKFKKIKSDGSTGVHVHKTFSEQSNDMAVQVWGLLVTLSMTREGEK
jgi:ribosomal protein L5